MFPNKRSDGRTGICSALMARENENTSYATVKETDVQRESIICILVIIMQIITFSLPSIFLANTFATRREEN
jgi:hypothetical protein